MGYLQEKPTVQLTPEAADALFERLRKISANHWATPGYKERLRDAILESLGAVDADQLYRDAYNTGRMHAGERVIVRTDGMIDAGMKAALARQGAGKESVHKDLRGWVEDVVDAAVKAAALPPAAPAGTAAGGT